MPADRKLLGRESEIEHLEQLLDQAPARGAALLVRGEAGVGKSALLTEAGRRASERGMQVLRTTGHMSEAQLPFAGLHQLLRPITPQISDLPLAQRDALLGAFGSGRDAPDLFLVALATLTLLSDTAARTSLLLIADDARWLDSPSREVLAFIARRLESDPIVLLIAIRDGDVDRSELPELHLEGLDENAAEALLDAQAGDLPVAVRERVLAKAGGNPLALVELAIAWTRHGEDASLLDDLPLTERLEHAFAARVNELPAVTRAMLLIAALNDQGSLAEMLEASAILTHAKPRLQDLAPAEAAQLVDLRGHGLRFCHPLIRSAIAQMAGLAQRHAAHAALAQTLVDHPDRGVWHAAASTVGPDEEIAAQLEATAMRAQRRSAPSVAIAALRRAVQLTADPGQRGRRLLAAAELASELARHDEVAELLRQLEPLELPDRERHKMVWFREFLADVSGGGSVQSMVDCARQLINDGEEQFALNALLTAALKCHWLRSDVATRESVATAASELKLAADDARLLGIYALATPATRGEIVIDLTSRITPADLLRQLPDESQAFEAMRLYAMALTTVPDNERTRDFKEAAIGGLRQQGKLSRLSLTLGAQSIMALALADWRLAERAGAEAIRLARESRQPRHAGAAQLVLAAVAATRGDVSDAETMTADAERTLAPFRPRWPFPLIEVVRATTALADGSYTEAFDRCSRIFDPSDVSHHWQTSHWALTLMDLADAAVHSGNVEAAKAIVESLNGPRNSLEFRWGTSYAAAVLTEGDADALVKRAFTSAPASEYAHARLHLAYGTRLRRQRRSSDSRPHLRAAQDGFDALGATPWFERAHEELRASGERSRRRAPDARDDLSPQEIQIALLAAEGLTNREIGARLFISHRTVGSHLYHIFPKLSITSRAELRGAISRFLPPAGEQDRQSARQGTSLTT
jgi:DNA-binding CsgD family transcriptional regulator